MSDTNDKIRIVQETVAGKEITFAHVIGGPAPIIYQKLGLNPAIDYGAAAIGIMNMTPPESAVIAADIAVKSGDVYLGFADRFTGTVIITGELADVTSALTEIVNYFRDELGQRELLAHHPDPDRTQLPALEFLIPPGEYRLQELLPCHTLPHRRASYRLVILHTTYPSSSRK